MGMGGSNKASNEANKAEEERIAAIKQAQGTINGVFDAPSRKADIADYVNATRGQMNDGLERQKIETDRELRFALARGGMTGGSVAVDKRRGFGEAYQRGLLDVERRAQGAGAGIESADQEARARLMGQATQGLDMTTAAAQSAASMRTNLAAGQAERNASSLGDAFAAFKTFTDRSREAADKRRADTAWGSYYGNNRAGGF